MVLQLFVAGGLVSFRNNRRFSSYLSVWLEKGPNNRTYFLLSQAKLSNFAHFKEIAGLFPAIFIERTLKFQIAGFSPVI
ncbi:hypothetical protein [Ammoniphilus sp. 3BR4]|uniref:hypothetical protein n=1 Tax=Ammoniphilus sp. 3BR4 TaxID=3158265 RepID=UPI0034674B98